VKSCSGPVSDITSLDVTRVGVAHSLPPVFSCCYGASFTGRQLLPTGDGATSLVCCALQGACATAIASFHMHTPSAAAGSLRVRPPARLSVGHTSFYVARLAKSTGPRALDGRHRTEIPTIRRKEDYGMGN
jgi:hypothetical protein